MAKKSKSPAKISRSARKVDPLDREPLPTLPFPVVGIGGSAGALDAFSQFFHALRADSGMAFVVIQHLPPQRNSLLAEILGKQTRMPVSEIKDGVKVEPNHVYVIRPGRTVTLSRGRLRLTVPVERPGHQRPVDDLFRSLADEQRERAIAILFSGMGSNGTAGAQAVKAVGGLCIAQEPESAQFPSMPRSLLEAGHADFILRPAEMADVLLRYIAHPYTHGSGAQPKTEAGRENQVMKEILALVRARLRLDFTGYKKPTLLRRMQRRMGLNQLASISDYARMLRQSPAEISALADELRIHVTGFFRDPEAWTALRKQVVRPLVHDREDGDAIRAWVTACASGEEAYSLAMILIEEAETSGKRIDIKIFATDTAERTLAHARTGVYPNGIESEISPERIERFFDKEDGVYRVKKEIRELVVFAVQNILQDPPFSRLDLCTCRNLLIYLEPEMQQRALGMLHFGLVDRGVLLLGTSETVSGTNELFEPIDKKNRLFRRIGPSRQTRVNFPTPRSRTLTGEQEAVTANGSRKLTIAQQAGRALLDRFSPAAVVVDRQLRIVFFHGHTERYLVQPRGEPTRELLDLIREPVRGAVRSALQQALQSNSPTNVLDGHVDTPAGRVRVEILAAPLHTGDDSHFLVCFLERPESPATPRSPQGGSKQNAQKLQSELERVRAELRNTIHELQLSNEEMKASAEEATSINEELQSSNEELETSKEELQSLNEELTTVNAQLHVKMEELEGATSDMTSLLSSTNIAVIFLDRQFRIRRFTPAARELIDLIPADLGRPLKDLARKFTDATLLPDAKAVLENLAPLECEMTADSGKVYMRRVLPYHTNDNRIEGVVITFVDISQRVGAESALRESEERHRLILEGIKEYAIFMIETDGRVATWTPSSERMLGYSAAETIGRSIAMIVPPAEPGDVPLETLLRQAREHGSVSSDRWYRRKDSGRFWGSGLLAALHDRSGQLRGFVGVLRDNTERKHSEEALQRAKTEAESANLAKDNFLATISHELRTPLTATLLWAKLLNVPELPEPEQLREGLSAIEQSAREQQALIEELVDTSRIVAGKLRLQIGEANLVQLVRSALDIIRPIAAEKGVAIVDSIDPEAGVVQADPLRLQQVLTNLLNNAVKFTPSGGRITVEMKRLGTTVEIVVTDTGQGVSPDFLPRIFDRFTQADAASGPKAGLGLGLSIAKQLVTLHGGEITADSAGLAKGCTFTVRLPLLKITPTSSSDPFGKPTTLQGQHILLVEDDPDTRMALTATLEGAGATVTAVDSAARALKEFKRRSPDLILSDIGLGRMSGHDLIARIRQREIEQGVRHVPAIALTAYTDEKNLALALKSGFHQVLSKPIEPSAMLRTLAAMYAADSRWAAH